MYAALSDLNSAMRSSKFFTFASKSSFWCFMLTSTPFLSSFSLPKRVVVLAWFFTSDESLIFSASFSSFKSLLVAVNCTLHWSTCLAISGLSASPPALFNFLFFLTSACACSCCIFVKIFSSLATFFGEFIILRTKGCQCFPSLSRFRRLPVCIEKLLIYDSPPMRF